MWANKARRVLINLGKSLPFFLCGILLIHYTETLYAMVLEDYVMYEGCYVANTDVSFMIANVFEYDMMIVLLVAVTCIAIETCRWNRIAVCYLALHILFKQYVESIELEQNVIVTLCIANIAICAFLIFKGVKRCAKSC